VRVYKNYSFEHLLTKLNQTDLVENGYTLRDLALGCMTTFHYFDLNKALKNKPLQKRILSYSSNAETLTIYPGLSEEDFKDILAFAQIEKWPMTSQGLFLQLKKQDDPQLAEAFYLTSQFHAVENLFSGTPREKLLTLIKEGEWMPLAAFVEKQKSSQDLSVNRRLSFLFEYLEQGSKTAAQLLIQSSPETIRKWNDETVAKILRLTTDKSPEAEKFIQEIIKSPRSDKVHELASLRQYEFSGEKAPVKYDQQTVSKQFFPKIPQQKIIAKQEVQQPLPPSKPPLKREIMHTVQEGDSLWKISRKYKIDIDQIRKYNRLQSDFLKPGTTLKIPTK
jgi:LysM repeat protein